MNIKTGLKAAKTIAAAATFGLTAVFMMASGSSAEAATHHKAHAQHHQLHHKAHHKGHQKSHRHAHHRSHHKPNHHGAAAQPAQQDHEPLSGSFARSNTLVYHVRSGRLEFNGRVYDAGSGNRNGYNNPSMSHVSKRGPVPAGVFPVTPREGLFHGTEAWRVLDTPGRSGILIHPASVRLRGRPFGESMGCIAVKEHYEQFKRDMHRLHPTTIVVKPL
jgi:hypothetical protein